ncbi:hypothetical protein OF83DRAFT_598897 [Amylostereum chailletii]|nr:hypothetical protein OF83DRAFT_598897 [Amylostereum chailletii]
MAHAGICFTQAPHRRTLLPTPSIFPKSGRMTLTVVLKASTFLPHTHHRPRYRSHAMTTTGLSALAQYNFSLRFTLSSYPDGHSTTPFPRAPPFSPAPDTRFDEGRLERFVFCSSSLPKLDLLFVASPVVQKYSYRYPLPCPYSSPWVSLYSTLSIRSTRSSSITPLKLISAPRTCPPEGFIHWLPPSNHAHPYLNPTQYPTHLLASTYRFRSPERTPDLSDLYPRQDPPVYSSMKALLQLRR